MNPLLLVWLTALAASTVSGSSPGRLDSSFAPEILTDGAIVATAVQTNGSIYVAGSFTKINGVARTNLARLLPDGSVDAGFLADTVIETQQSLGAASYYHLAEYADSKVVALPDGGVLITGWRRVTNRLPVASLFRFWPTGQLDTNFAPRFERLRNPEELNLSALELQSAGQVIVAGNFSHVNGLPRYKLARLQADGSLDLTFTPGLETGLDDDTLVRTLALQSDGKLIVGGGRPGTYGRMPIPVLLRLNPDGSLDQTWRLGYSSYFFGNPFSVELVHTVKVQRDQRIVVGWSSYNGPPIVRLHPDGAPDESFQFRASFRSGAVTALDLDEEGKERILAVSGDWYYSMVSLSTLVRLNADGSEDLSFNPSPELAGQITSIHALPNNQVLLAGTLQLGTNRATLAVLQADGTPAATPRPLAHQPGYVGSILPALAGQTYIAGSFTEINSVRRPYLGRLKPDGRIDEGFEAGLTNYPDYGSPSLWLLATQPDGKLILAKQDSIGSTLVRLNLDGGPDPNFIPQTAQVYGRPYAAVQADGKIVCASMTLPDTGYSEPVICRLQSNGMPDTEFTPYRVGFSTQVHAALQKDGRVLWSDGVLLARLNRDGSPDETFHDPFGDGNSILGLAVERDGNILVSRRSSVDPECANGCLSRLHEDGSLDTTFQSDLRGAYLMDPADPALQADGKILLLTANVIGSQVHMTVTRLQTDGTWDTGFASALFEPGAPHTLIVQPDGGILAAGSFATVDGTARVTVTRLQGGEPDPHAPAIVSGPTNTTVYAGASVTFEVVATGAPQLSYQWQRNGADLPGATRRVLKLAGVTTNDSASYAVVVENALGVETTTPAVLDVIPTAPLTEALNNTNLNWLTFPAMNPTNAWVGVFDVSHDGQHAARNQPLTDNGIAALTTQFDVPGTLSFWWKVSSEHGYDYLQFLLDDDLRASISGEVPWQPLSFTVIAGQRAQWRYVKDESLSSGADCGWIDEVLFTPSPLQPFSLQIAPLLPQNRFRLSWTGEPGRAYTLQASTDLKEWTTLTNSVCTVPGMSYIDTDTWSYPQRFYRLVTP